MLLPLPVSEKTCPFQPPNPLQKGPSLQQLESKCESDDTQRYIIKKQLILRRVKPA